MRIYLASSWRNPIQPEALLALRADGHDVYDFRNPEPGNTGFGWRQVDPPPVDSRSLIEALKHPIARRGFDLDMNALRSADCTVLLLPCGRSAHLEAGFAIGRAQRSVIVLSDEKFEPELMYLMADAIVPDLKGMVEAVRSFEPHRRLSREHMGTKVFTDGLGGQCNSPFCWCQS